VSSGNVTVTGVNSTTTLPVPTTDFIHILGKKRYELENHLGNVLATVSDRKIANPSGSCSANTVCTVGYFTADVITAQDYYPFGMEMLVGLMQ